MFEASAKALLSTVTTLAPVPSTSQTSLFTLCFFFIGQLFLNLLTPCRAKSSACILKTSVVSRIVLQLYFDTLIRLVFGGSVLFLGPNLSSSLLRQKFVGRPVRAVAAVIFESCSSYSAQYFSRRLRLTLINLLYGLFQTPLEASSSTVAYLLA